MSYQILSCSLTSLESQGSLWWLRHRGNRNPCFRDCLKSWDKTVWAHLGTKPTCPAFCTISLAMWRSYLLFPWPSPGLPKGGSSACVALSHRLWWKRAGSTDMICITPRKVLVEPIQWQGIELCLRVKEREMLALSSPFHFTEDSQQDYLLLFPANILSWLTAECSLLNKTQNEDPSL